MGEVTLLNDKTVPFQNMYRVNTGFHVRKKKNGAFYLKSAINQMKEGAMVQNLWNEQTIEI